MGLFDDLLPRSGGLFGDLIPVGQPDVMTTAPSLADMFMSTVAPADPAPLDRPDQSSLGGDWEAGLLQAGQLIPGMKIAGGIKQIERGGWIDEGGDLAGDLGFAITPEDAADMEARKGALVQAGIGQIAEALPDVMERSEAISRIPMNPAAADMGAPGATLGDVWDAFTSDPAGVLRTFGVRSIPGSLPTVGASVLGSVGGPAGAAGAAGVVGAGTEQSASIAQSVETAMRGAGITEITPEAVAAFVQEHPDALGSMMDDATTRALIIGAADALTGGASGLLARGAAQSGAPGKIAEAIIGGGLIEPLGEGAGEAGAQYATTGKIHPGDVAAEIAGGLTMGVPTTAGQIAVEGLRPGEAAATAAPAASPALADILAAAMEQPPAPGVAAPEPAPPLLPPMPAETPPPAVSAPVSSPSAPTAPEAATAAAPGAAAPSIPEEPVVTPGSLPPDAGAQPLPAPPTAVPPPTMSPEAPTETLPASTETPPPPTEGLPPPVDAPKEPARPQKRPLTRALGVQIDPDGEAGRELYAMGVTPKTNPGLFRRGGLPDIDNIPAAEHPEIARVIGEDGNGYLSRNGILDAIREEAQGRPVLFGDHAEIDAHHRAWQEAVASLGEAPVASAPLIDTPAAHVIDPETDLATPGERYARVTTDVDEALRALRLDGRVTPEERSAIIDHLDRSGGNIEDAIERQIIRTVLNAEAGEPVYRPDYQPLPGWEEDEAPAAGGGGAGEPGGDALRPAGSDASNRDDRRAGPGPAPSELTPEGEQLLVPGTETRQTGEAQRQKAEVAARQQQSKIRRGDQKRVEDDDDSLFGEKPETLLDRGDSALSRRPPGRLSPRFIDHSFTNRASVFGAAFQAAGIDPAEGRNLPIEKQVGAVRGALQDRFGIKVDMPAALVRKKNLVGRTVTVAKKSITTREALDQMLDAFRQMQMLASILGVPEKALALEIDGKPLTLSLVSTKRMRGALGSFSSGPEGRTITLPGRSNSFAHEWAHALDHWLTTAAGRDPGFLSRRMDQQGVPRPLSPKAAVVEAYAGIMRALYGDHAQISALILRLQSEAAQIGADGKPTPAAVRAQRLMHDLRAGKRVPDAYLSAYFKTSADYDKATAAGDYFTDPAEMFARAFEAWAGATVATISPDLPQSFLSKGFGYENDVDPRLRMTFPKGADAAQFAVAMGELQHAMTRVNLFPGEAAARPDDVSILSDNALLKRIPKEGFAAREAAAARRTVDAWRRVFKRGSLSSTTSSVGEMARGVWNDYLNSLTASLHSIAVRQADPDARKAFTNIADMLGADPGSGRFMANTWQQDVEVKGRRRLNMISAALAKHGREQFTDAERSTLRALLTGQKVQANASMKALAGDLRAVLDNIWYDLKDAGVQVGYAAGYLPRIPNLAEVDKDPKGFVADARKVYALMFDREVIQNDDAEAQRKDINAVIRGLRSAVIPTPEGEVVGQSRLTAADEALIAAWRKKDTDATRGAMLAVLQERYGLHAAERWRSAMRVGDANDFDTMGPQASFLKGRVLPPEADAILERWLENDPLELIPGYAHSAARRAEYARRFGAAGEKLETMLKAAEDAGATSDDIHHARKAVNSATGRFRHPSKAGERFSTAVYFTATLSMLGRATFASIAEPMVTGLRTGDVRDSARALVSQVRLLSKSRREDLHELARTIGLTTSSMQESVLANRLGADSAALTKGFSRGLARYFALSLLTPLTNLQRVGSIPVAHAVIMRHLRAGTRWADGELNELGIGQEDRADLLAWLDDLGGVPSPDDLLAPDGSYYNRAAGLWASAVVRLTDQTIQNPQKSDRPVMANHPSVAPLYGIMSFIMSFQRNILVRNVRRIRRNQGAGAAHFAAGIGVLIMGQFLATVVREALFNRDMWEEKEDDDDLLDWLFWRAFNRAGLTGVFDPLVQLTLGVKYDRDLTTIAAGPHAGYMLQNVQRIIEAFAGRNSPNTNTAEWNASRAFYQLLMQPAMMAAISTLGPAGPLTGALSTAGIWWWSSPQASSAWADLMNGEKGRNYEDEGEDAPWWEIAD
ncbi:MAG: hypothetical protein KAX54_00325 [Thauera sp.]|nr:hypothetical protein [Thauera sp.]